jgi:hypothetical protein
MTAEPNPQLAPVVSTRNRLKALRTSSPIFADGTMCFKFSTAPPTVPTYWTGWTHQVHSWHDKRVIWSVRYNFSCRSHDRLGVSNSIYRQRTTCAGRHDFRRQGMNIWILKTFPSECGPSYSLFKPFLIRWFEAESRDEVLGGLRTWGLHTGPYPRGSSIKMLV